MERVGRNSLRCESVGPNKPNEKCADAAWARAEGASGVRVGKRVSGEPAQRTVRTYLLNVQGKCSCLREKLITLSTMICAAELQKSLDSGTKRVR